MLHKKEVSLIGLGPMGQAVAKIYLNNQYKVTVWNRTERKSVEMAAFGAKKANTIAELLKANDTVLICLTDYEVMYKLLGTETKFLKGKILVNLSSDTPENTRKAAKWAEEHGAAYITGAIMVVPETLGQPDALIFYSADENPFNSYKSMLEPMGKAEYVGNDPGLAQLFSIGLLNILFTANVAILQSIALLQQAGIRPTTYQPYINGFISGLPEMLDDVIKDAETGNYDGEMNNMDMMTAAMGHVAQTTRDARINSAMTDIVEKIMKEAVDTGHGANGLASVIEILRAG